MVSYSDRPTERERDLEDIAHLLDSYVDEVSERRWDEAFECSEFDLQPAYLFGLDTARIIESAEHESIVNGFLRKLEQTESAAHLLLLSHGPRRWHTDYDALGKRVGAFRAGMQRGLAQR